MKGKVFCRTWKVIAGGPHDTDTPKDKPQYHVHIEKRPKKDKKDERTYQITYSKNCKRQNFKQTLYFDKKTSTLNSRPSDKKPQRCIAFWKRSGGDKNCIFAMWHAMPGEERFPWEHPPLGDTPGDNGTWGADAG